MWPFKKKKEAKGKESDISNKTAQEPEDDFLSIVKQAYERSSQNNQNALLMKFDTNKLGGSSYAEKAYEIIFRSLPLKFLDGCSFYCGDVGEDWCIAFSSSSGPQLQQIFNHLRDCRDFREALVSYSGMTVTPFDKIVRSLLPDGKMLDGEVQKEPGEMPNCAYYAFQSIKNKNL